MHSEGAKEPESGTKLLVVCVRSDFKEVRSIVSKCAPLDWGTAREIQVLPIADMLRRTDAGPEAYLVESKAKIVERIERAAPPLGGARVLIARATRLEGLYGLRNAQKKRDIEYFKSCHDLQERLPIVLKQCGLDWFTVKARALEHYRAHQPGAVEAWFRQFAKLGYEPVGRSLLQLLDFWPTSKFEDALFEFRRERGGPQQVEDWLS
jgi:hypothetical protein